MWSNIFSILLILAAIANLFAVVWLVEIAKKKNPNEMAGVLWFVGLFGSSLMLGIIVCAMPDDRLVPRDELPTGSETDYLPKL